MRYRIPDTILLQAVSDEMVILNPETGVYFTLDAIGTRMLELLRQLQDEEAVADVVVSEYETDRNTVLSDLAGLLAKMAAHGLAEDCGHEAS
ncbi:PqqD family protein [Congregibacter variabilis]|uniref:PqqD family protein n=1 Tax=Congregibacter variabilis TaxID=3081200 RepID=A0ABZ0I740_9GAMM|nr:PqqD family protein [Congregibacter sp. IMCC43200]